MRKTNRRFIKSHLPPDVHLANKNEAKELRKIRSKTGMTEEEVRSIKKYRIDLSKAQKRTGNQSAFEKHFISLVKNITKELKLPKEHPKVLEALSEKIKEKQESSMSYGFYRRQDIHYKDLPTTHAKLLDVMKWVDGKKRRIKNEKNK